jgi:solute carrier family 10 (sodium/bile acid cotransporter), member 7
MATRVPIDPFIVALVAAAVLAFFMPASGPGATLAGYIAKAAIALLFFLQGVRLQRSSLIAGLTHWRLQLLTFACTFVLFPVLGLALHASFRGLLDDSLWLGVLYLCALPSTIQSSIAFTAIARGNVAAAMCAATASNLIGIVLSPLLVAALLNLKTNGAAVSPLAQIQAIVLQLLVPFVAGQIASRWLRPWALRNAKLLMVSDRSSIIFVVYTAFSAAVLTGVWSDMSGSDIARILLISAFLLAVALVASRLASRAAGFSIEDEIAVVFCGSKKSLVTGVPLANILFPAPMVGIVILPILVFHQIQLIVCAELARRYARRPEPAPELDPASRQP